jgi:hypothetical protein
VIERSTRCSSDWWVCSSTIGPILIALPSMVESNWKSDAHSTFGASAIASGAEDVLARLRGEWTRTRGPSSHHNRCTFFTLMPRLSSWCATRPGRAGTHGMDVEWRRHATRPACRHQDRQRSPLAAAAGG